MVEEMLTHALPPLVEAGNKAALEVLAQKAGVDPATLVHNHCHTIIAKCLYEGTPRMMHQCPWTVGISTHDQVSAGVMV